MNTDNQNLFIIRGVSGSGKSTLSKQLCKAKKTVRFGVDDFFYDEVGEYHFNMSQLGAAHKQCRHNVESYLRAGYSVVVDNTNTTERSVKTFIAIAERYNIQYTVLTVENWNNTKDVHKVPKETLVTQARQLNQSMKLTADGVCYL